MLALGVSGCSLWPWQSVPAAAVSNDLYVGMSCEELRNENDRLLAEAIDLRPRLAPGQGEEQRKKDVALISGEMDAVNRLRAAKKCEADATGLNELPPIEKGLVGDEGLEPSTR